MMERESPRHQASYGSLDEVEDVVFLFKRQPGFSFSFMIMISQVHFAVFHS